MSVSVDSGRCGPCCSVAPSGTASSAFAAAAPSVRGRQAGEQLAHAAFSGDAASPSLATLPATKSGRHDHVVGRQVVDRRAPEPEQRRVDAAAQDVEHVLDAGLAVGGQPPQVRAADHHRAGAERERLDDVAAAPDAAVEQDLDLVADRVGDRGQRADRGRRAVEVVAAVVGDRDRVDADRRPRAAASSTRMTPLSMNGPSHCSRSQATSVPATAAASASTRRRRRRRSAPSPPGGGQVRAR